MSAPVVDRCFPLNGISEAFRHFGEGHFKEGVVITFV